LLVGALLTILVVPGGTCAATAAETTVQSRFSLSAPAAPISVGRLSRFTTSGSVAPASGATDVRVRCYRRESGAWVLRKTLAATVHADGAGAATYTLRLRLGTGRWRLRALATGGEYAPTLSRRSDLIRVGATADRPIWNRDGVLTLPERMASRRNATQLIIATGSRLGSRSGRLYLFEYRRGDWVRVASMGARFGKRGLTDGRTRRSGTLTTPTGIWRMPRYVFGRRATPPSGMKIAYRRITWRSWWSAERGSTYNRWVESRYRVYGEHLADYPVQYEYAASTGYNAWPNRSIYGRGSAIFLHVHGSGYTAGCVSLARSDMVRVFRWLDSTKKPAFAIGTRRTGTATCIRRY
jgi:L,D-peptidoglycan transpeptidase YkuD (ErfK/YbiS/YcfS/YnhG family)